MARNINGGTDTIRYGGATYTVGCITFWMKTTQTTANALPVSIWSGSSRTGCGFLINNTANKMTVQCYNATATPAFNQAGTTTINDGAWHHVAFNFNTANGSTQTLYIDSASAASGAAGAAWSFASTTITLGDSLDAFWPTYVGDLAEAGFWARNLDTAEIAALAKGFSPLLIGGVDFYAPLVRDTHNRRDATNSVTGTTVSDHPRIMAGLT